MSNLKKIYRFITIYGIRRTLIKTLGRLRLNVPAWIFINPLRIFSSKHKIGVIGCGHYSFSTVAFFLIKNGHRRISSCYDINVKAAESFSKAYGAVIAEKYQNVINSSDIIYITSNHATHTDYALASLQAGKVVFCEKPISVTKEQLQKLGKVILNTEPNTFFVGYNRPHSPIVKRITTQYQKRLQYHAISLNCFVIGHDLSIDHWYRDPSEGTRVCGNLGHWIDLFIHLISFRKKEIINYKLSIVSSDPDVPDDNCILTLTTDQKDIFSIFISSRAEPFEGINETINLQCSDLHVKINDFRSYETREGNNYKRKKIWPKNVGHELSILQPFRSDFRPQNEYLLSSLLMINFMEMMHQGEAIRNVNAIELHELFT